LPISDTLAGCRQRPSRTKEDDIAAFLNRSTQRFNCVSSLLTPDLSKLRVVGLTREMAESYAPLSITVSYAGQDGTPKPFLMIIDWLKVGKDWKIASEIILPVPPASPVKG
jgi:hypothetical protein